MAKAKTPGGRRTGEAQTAAAGQTVTVDAPAPKKRTSPVEFLNQVRAEGRKIVWPTRKETWITSVMVFIMVAIAAVFFWGVDFVLGLLSDFIYQIGR